MHCIRNPEGGEEGEVDVRGEGKGNATLLKDVSIGDARCLIDERARCQELCPAAPFAEDDRSQSCSRGNG